MPLTFEGCCCLLAHLPNASFFSGGYGEQGCGDRLGQDRAQLSDRQQDAGRGKEDFFRCAKQAINGSNRLVMGRRQGLLRT